jgi:hypothetical protein
MNLACLAYHKLLSPAVTRRFAAHQLTFTISAPKAGEVPENLPQQLRHAIADTLASTETSSNSDFLNSDCDDDDNDDYRVTTGFAKLQRMQRFLRISDYLLNDEPCNDDFINRFDGYKLSWP